MEDIWNITALVVSVLSVLLSLYALRQATTKNTSDMYLFFISQYAKEDMKLALRKRYKAGGISVGTMGE